LASLALTYLIHNLFAHDVPAGLCNAAVSLSLANREADEEKFKRKKIRVSDLLFWMAVGSEIKHSRNCLPTLILSNYRKTGASRIG
jgi:hypothetical protein